MEEKEKEVKNGYSLSRQWYDFAFENPDKVSPNHCALWFWIIELCNRLGWKEKFGLPTVYSMEAMGVRSYNTYKAALNDLISWGFIKLIEKSQNQYTANIIAISNFNKAQYKALDKALTKHTTKQNDIDKQVNKETIKPETDGEAFIPSEIISYLNEKAGKRFRPNITKTIDLITARQNEGWKQQDFIKVIDNKVAAWKDDPKMNCYLRPLTLFGTKFEAYLNEVIIPHKTSPAKRDISKEVYSPNFIQ